MHVFFRFIVSVRKNHQFQTSTQAAIEDTIKRWLRNAADREGGRIRRKARPNYLDDVERDVEHDVENNVENNVENVNS